LFFFANNRNRNTHIWNIPLNNSGFVYLSSFAVIARHWNIKITGRFKYNIACPTDRRPPVSTRSTCNCNVLCDAILHCIVWPLLLLFEIPKLSIVIAFNQPTDNRPNHQNYFWKITSNQFQNTRSNQSLFGKVKPIVRIKYPVKSLAVSHYLPNVSRIHSTSRRARPYFYTYVREITIRFTCTRISK